MKELRLGVTGTRFGISKEQYVNAQAWLEKPFWNRDYVLTEFHHGDCVGADIQLATMVQTAHPHVKIICHPPVKTELRGYYESHIERKPKSYFARNRDIVAESDMLIAFPLHEDKSKGGTWYTINHAKKKGVKTGIFFYDGRKEQQ